MGSWVKARQGQPPLFTDWIQGGSASTLRSSLITACRREIISLCTAPGHSSPQQTPLIICSSVQSRKDTHYTAQGHYKDRTCLVLGTIVMQAASQNGILQHRAFDFSSLRIKEFTHQRTLLILKLAERKQLSPDLGTTDSHNISTDGLTELLTLHERSG